MNSIKKELFKANVDILSLFRLVKEIGWDFMREQSVQRILYLSKVLYYFVYETDQDFLKNYYFSTSISGPYSDLISRSIIDLKSRELIHDTPDGNISEVDDSILYDFNELHSEWFKTVIYILGLYGEHKIFNFTIRDPLYQESIAVNSPKAIVASSESKTIQFLKQFKIAFEESLSDVSAISKREYLEFYFEYVFSEIIKREE